MFLDQLVDQAGTGSQLLVSLQRQASVTSTCSQLTAMSAHGNTFSNIANGIECIMKHVPHEGEFFFLPALNVLNVNSTILYLFSYLLYFTPFFINLVFLLCSEASRYSKPEGFSRTLFAVVSVSIVEFTVTFHIRVITVDKGHILG